MELWYLVLQYEDSGFDVLLIGALGAANKADASPVAPLCVSVDSGGRGASSELWVSFTSLASECLDGSSESSSLLTMHLISQYVYGIDVILHQGEVVL